MPVVVSRCTWRRSSCGIFPGASPVTGSCVRPWRRARACSVPSARSVPKGSSRRAVQRESRPKSVRYQGVPAAAKTCSGDAGSRRTRWRRSSRPRSTVRASRWSWAVTRTSSQASASEPGSASKAEACSRSVVMRRQAEVVRPGSTTRVVSSATEPSSPGRTATVAPGGSSSRATVVRCQSSVRTRPSAVAVAAVAGPLRWPDFTAPMSRPSPAMTRRRGACTVCAAREVMATCSVRGRVPGPSWRLPGSAPRPLSEHVAIASRAAQTVHAPLRLVIAGDGLDIGAVKSGHLSGPPTAATATAAGLVLTAAWHRTTVALEELPPGATVAVRPGDDGSVALETTLVVEPGRTTSACLRITTERLQASAFDADPGSDALAWDDVRVTAQDHRLARTVERGLDDLRHLVLRDPESPDHVFAAAGTPWYLTLFGRDSLWTARLLLPFGTDLAEGTLHTLARRQGTTHDPVTGEAPGTGLANQGWKDSGDSIRWRDGTVADAPIALVEAQAYAVEALRAAARLHRSLGDDD